MDKKVAEAACLQLVTERQILRQLLCTSHNQHRRAIYFRQLVGVRRSLDAVNVDRVASMLRSAGKQVEELSQLRRSSVPASVLPLLHGMSYAANLCRDVIVAADKVSKSMYAQLATGFFAPLALTTLALMGRVLLNSRVLLRALLKSWDLLAALRLRLLCRHRLEQSVVEGEARAMQAARYAPECSAELRHGAAAPDSDSRPAGGFSGGRIPPPGDGPASDGGRCAAAGPADAAAAARSAHDVPRQAPALRFGLQAPAVVAAPDTDEES